MADPATGTPRVSMADPATSTAPVSMADSSTGTLRVSMAYPSASGTASEAGSKAGAKVKGYGNQVVLRKTTKSYVSQSVGFEVDKPDVRPMKSTVSNVSTLSNVSKFTEVQAESGVDPLAGAGANELQGRNIVLLFCYLGSFGYIGLEAFGVTGEGRNAIVDVAPTVVTPVYTWFVLFWLPVGIACGIFVVVQLLPRFRTSELIPIVAPFWGPICLLQAFWAYELGQVSEDHPSALVPFVAMLVAAALSLASLLSMDMVQPTFFEFWFIRAPFSLHASWLLCLAFLTTNMYAASPGVDAFSQDSELAIAICSLILVFVLTVLFSVATRRPDPIFPLSVFWTGICIYLHSRDIDANTELLLKKPELAGPVTVGMGFASLQIAMGCIWMVAAAILLRTVVCYKLREQNYLRSQELEKSQNLVMFT